MGIQKDAGEILVYFYKNKVESKKFLRINILIEETGWEENRIFLALEYLLRKRLLIGQIKRRVSDKIRNIIITDVLPDGIDIVENESKFIDTFGFGINLAIFQFSWTRQKK